jgi:hypothetical protein
MHDSGCAENTTRGLYYIKVLVVISSSPSMDVSAIYTP